MLKKILRGTIINDMEIILVTISRVPLRQPEPRNYEIIFILAESRGQRSDSVFTCTGEVASEDDMRRSTPYGQSATTVTLRSDRDTCG